MVLGYRMGAAQENISQEIIKSMKMLIPDKTTIDAYGEKVKPIFDVIEKAMLQNARLREARDILLPRLMTGMIDVDQYQPENLIKDAA